MEPLSFESWSPFALSLGLGLLVGFQRERNDAQPAGVRTFAMLTLFGTLCGTLGDRSSPWVIVAGLLAVVGLIAVGSPRPRPPERSTVTTEAAMLLMFVVGASIPYYSPWLAVVLSSATALLLQFKPALHGLVRKVGDKDLKAIVQFIIVSGIVLPLVPTTEWGPDGAVDLHATWWMVVLIVGIGLAAYIAYKAFGSRAGVLLSGVLGGAISSTATTATYARRSKGNDGGALLAAVVVLIAAATAYTRQLIEVAAVSRELLPEAAMRIGAVGATMALAALIGVIAVRKQKAELPEPENPAQLKVALIFAALYTVIHLAAALGKQYLGTAGLYAVSAVSGLTDIDAITLSTSKQVASGALDADEGAHALLIASLSNTVFKLGMVTVLGSRRMAVWVGAGFGLAIAVGVAMFFVPALMT